MRAATTGLGQRFGLALLFPLFFAFVALSHWPLLRLPYFWDEGGYYIPAALDFFHTGTLIPQSTVTNAHPPLPSLLLAGWWSVAGTAIPGTRLLVCLVAAAALLGVYRLTLRVSDWRIAGAVTLLTSVYPVWFAQSTLAHADIFAAAFSLWAFSFYLEEKHEGQPSGRVFSALLFSLAALSKETAIVTPLALAGWELLQAWAPQRRRGHVLWAVALASPLLPLVSWYAFHYLRTGFIFGNPEFLRYNATANLSAHRIAICFWHRCLHLFAHMNMFAATAVALLLMPLPRRMPALTRRTVYAVAVVLASNLVAFSVLGGALLTRYLLPLFPLVLLLCVVEWRCRTRYWVWVAGLVCACFVCGIFVNPPYAFAPEDNLAYRDMILLHEQAIAVIDADLPKATVLTAWPATSELGRPELGYTHTAIQSIGLQNFSAEQMQVAASLRPRYDAALVFSTKWEPPPGKLNIARRNEATDTRYFDFHHDLSPTEAASVLQGEILWQANRRGQWAAVLRFPADTRR